MNRAEYDTMHAMEDTHWWYQGLRSMLAHAVRQLDLREGGIILDAGCGTGANLGLMRRLAPRARFIALDISPAALSFIGPAEDVTVLSGDVNALPLADASVDVIFAGDLLGQRGVVVASALDHFFRVLKPGGRLLANIPAFDWLRGGHDLAVHVDKRFAPGELASSLRQAGFADVAERFWNLCVLPAMFARRLISRRRRPDMAEPRSDLMLTPAWLNDVLAWWLERETGLACRVHLPIGSSLFVIARKPSAPFIFSNPAP